MSDTGSLSDEQKRYIEGFLRGIATSREGAALDAPVSSTPTADIHRAAQDRFIAEGKKLVPEEEAKRKGHPLDMWDELAAEAKEDRAPKGIDVFRHKFFGLFYASPAQEAFMCRLRIPNGILTSYQLEGLADLADEPRRRLCRYHDPGQSADPGDQARRHHRGVGDDPGPRPDLARRRRRQYPQHHRQPDRRHRPRRN